MSEPAERLFVALDVERLDEAEALLDRLSGVVGGCKIGSQLFTAAGPLAIERALKRGYRVFLDLKYHDIPNTVAQAVEAATNLGVWMLNVHASGGRRMMVAAIDAAHETAAKRGQPAPFVIAVTVLTSMNETLLAEVGITDSVLDEVVRLAQLTQASGLDGVVASAQETALIRKECGKNFAIVTPGIRDQAPEGAKRDDQERTMTAAEAIAAGSSYLVVGRPIIAAADPRAAAEKIVATL